MQEHNHLRGEKGHSLFSRNSLVIVHMRLQRFLFTLIDQCSVLVNQRIHNFGNVRPWHIIPARRSVVSYQTMSLIHMLLRIFSCRDILPSYRFLTNMLRIISISTHVNQLKPMPHPFFSLSAWPRQPWNHFPLSSTTPIHTHSHIARKPRPHDLLSYLYVYSHAGLSHEERALRVEYDPGF